MDITNNFQVNTTGRREPLFRGVECSPYSHTGIDLYYNEEYILRGEIGVLFRATDAHYQDALKDAKRHLYRLIYQPIIDEVLDMNEAIWAHDYKKIEQTCSKLVRMMQGKECN